MKQDPFRDLMNLQERMKRLFEESLRATTKGGSSPSWTPPVDVYETAGEFVVEAELPQLDKEHIDIHVEGNNLVLKGQRDQSRDDEGQQRSYHQRERPFGTFQRRFSLPAHIDLGQIAARFQDGVLSIRIAKRQQSAPRQIPID